MGKPPDTKTKEYFEKTGLSVHQLLNLGLVKKIGAILVTETIKREGVNSSLMPMKKCSFCHDKFSGDLSKSDEYLCVICKKDLNMRVSLKRLKKIKPGKITYRLRKSHDVRNYFL